MAVERPPEPRGIGGEISRLVGRFRRALRLTRDEIASHVGRDEVTVRRWETGGRVPSAKDVARLEAVLARGQPVLLTTQAQRSPPPDAPSPIRVFLVEDDDQVRAATRTSLEAEASITVIGEESSAEAGFKAILARSPDIAIIDIRLGQASGLDLAKQIRSTSPHVRLLILSGYDYAPYVRMAAAVGIDGYLTKDAPPAELVETVRSVAAGEGVLPLKVASRALGCVVTGVPEPHEAHLLRSLTRREMETLELICQDLRNEEIAQELGVSLKTVEDHVSSVLKKLRVRGRGQAVRVANKLGGVGRVVPE